MTDELRKNQFMKTSPDLKANSIAFFLFHLKTD